MYVVLGVTSSVPEYLPPYPLLTKPGLKPRLESSLAINLTKGVFPVPPIEIFPTTIKGLGEIQTFFGLLIKEFLLALTNAENKKVNGAKIYSQKLLLYQASIK